MYKRFYQAGCGILAAAAIFLCWLIAGPEPEGFPILEYHMVTTEPPEDAEVYNVPPEEFRAQMDYLAEQGYTTITPLQYMKAKKGKAELPEKPIILSFDDGYEDNYDIVLPILEEHGMKAVVYMVTNRIGTRGYLSWDQMRDMQARGIEIGSHTANHLSLVSMSPEERLGEIRLSKLIMEWNGINTVFSLSYPNGDYDMELTRLLRENEYLTAVTGDAGLNTFQTDPYQLQRVNIPNPKFGMMEFRWRLLKAKWMAKLDWGQHLE